MKLLNISPNPVSGPPAAEEIIYGPSAYDTVVRHHDDRCQHHKSPDPFPSASGSKFPECPESIGLASAPDYHFRDQDRKTQQEEENDVNENEGCPAVLPHHIGEAPQVAQADSRSCHSDKHTETVAEILSLHIKSVLFDAHNPHRHPQS